MLKKTSAFVGIAAVAALLAGCSSSGSANSGSTTVSFSGQTQEQAIWEPLFQAFEKANPGIKVDARFTPNDSYPQLVQTQLQGGQAADVIQTTPGTGGGLAALNLASGGKLADLSKGSWTSSLPASTKPLVSLDGKVYAYPTDVAPLFVAYNPDVFSKAGVQVPKTFQELTTACTKIADSGITPISVAGGSFQNVSILLQTIAANDVFGQDPDWNQKKSSKSVSFADSKNWQKVLSDVEKMKAAKCFAQDIQGVKAPVHLQRFAAGQAAMAVIPAQAISQIRSSAPANFKFSSFAFPGDTADETRVSASSGIALVVNAKAKDNAAAMKLLDFLSQPEQRASYAEHAGTIAPNAGPNNSDIYPEVLEPLKPYMDPSKVLTLNYLFWPNAGVAQQLATSAQGLFTGQKTSDQILSDTDKAWDANSK
ncbi:raffinose/stachyose/melibiose transport system substrate-binding protein [Paenarthrobacter nicotinovorans]|uniref:ABC transporter substrate-binding protein n=1 Tax=Paenarthrobacter nicotinovorans TaxID=29320 RepID=UPI0027822FB7|nr:ABC transporter substrate-binding protein [Paenarthrobacter nicotinovorans]MDP9936760.1 raffinose/stachyose/melibiose transport system substrate-binding protein [Paenarthrobacter nicotinovorans]